MNHVTNRFFKKEEHRGQKKKQKKITENEDTEKRTEDIFTKNSFWVFYLLSVSLEKIFFFYNESKQILKPI